MNKTEFEESSMIQDLSDGRRVEKTISSFNSFIPKYLNLHRITETSKVFEADEESRKYSSLKTYTDVVFISEEGEFFVCNKLYLIR